MTWSALVLMVVVGAQAPLDEGLALFNSGNFEAALTQVEALLRLEKGSAERARFELLRARCYLALRRPLDGDDALASALIADPTLTIEGLDVSPAFVAIFERARTRLAAQLTVETEPVAAGIRIDGVLVGAAPVKQLLAVGVHRVEVIDANGSAFSVRQVVIAARQPQTLVLSSGAPLLVQGPPPAPVQTPWVAVPALVARSSYDLGSGASFELGVTLLGRYWLAELDAMFGAFGGAGLRLGGRLPIYRALLGAQLTLDGQLIFSRVVVPGIGGTLSVVVHPVSWLDVLAEGSVRFVQSEPSFRAQYGLVGLALRVRWPFADEPS